MAKRRNVWLLLVELIVLASYLPVLKIFFQQDEWLSFGYKFLASGDGITNVLKDAFIPSVGHYQPLNTLVLYLLFWLFKLNYLPYAILSISLHLVVVYLIFQLFKHFFQDLKISLLVALFFGVNASIFQTTSWLLADISVHFSTVFALLSLIFFFQFIETSKRKKFIISLLFLIISLLFKEITLGLFILLPLSFYIFIKKRLHVKKIYPVTIIFLGIAYLGIRFLMVFVPQSYSRDTLVIKSQSRSNIIYNILTLPIVGVSQSFISAKPLVDVSYSITGLLSENVRGQKNTTQYGVFAEENVLGIVNVLVFLTVLVISFFAWRKNKKNIFSKLILFNLALILLNIPIFALSPERFGKISIIDSRNLYFVSIGSASLMVIFVLSFAHKRLIKVILFLLILIFNILFLRNELSQVADESEVRLKILNIILSTDPKLPHKVVFYIQSDSSYYGLPVEEKILPFQSGFGQTVLVWYEATENFPKSFFEGKFLWEIKDQGYKEDGGRGFGYFRNFDLLMLKVKEYNLSTSSVIAFDWNKKSGKLTDISKEIREKLMTRLK